MTNILQLPQLDGANTSFVIMTNEDWLDSLFFGAPGYPGLITANGAIVAGQNTITVNAPNAVPGMSIAMAGSPGIPAGAFVGSTTGTSISMVSGLGVPLNATQTDASASLSFLPPPLDLTGIKFLSNLRKTQGASQVFLTAQTDGNTMINGGTSGTLAFNVLEATMNSVAPGSYVLDILAIADGHIINLFPQTPASVIVAAGISDPTLLV